MGREWHTRETPAAHLVRAVPGHLLLGLALLRLNLEKLHVNAQTRVCLHIKRASPPAWRFLYLRNLLRNFLMQRKKKKGMKARNSQTWTLRFYRSCP